MKSGADTRSRSVRSGPRSPTQTLKSGLVYLWDVYSAPAPGCRDVLTLLLLCLTLAIATGGLLHHWLSETLKYDRGASVRTACVYGAAVLLVSFLCHPLRCVLTMILPTVCTKQGRKLLISASVMVLVVNVIPNITVNVGAAAHILKCTAEGFTKTLLNFSEPLNRAKTDIVHEAMKVKSDDLRLVTNLRKFEHFTHVDVSEVKNLLRRMLDQMEVNFSHIQSRITDGKLTANRVLAALLVALLIFESSHYLKWFLTSDQFDNVLVCDETEGSDRTRTRTRTKVSGCRIMGQEFTSCLISLLEVTLYYTALTLIVALDHVVYYIVEVTMPWFMDVATVSAVISVRYKVQWFAPAFCLIPRSCGTQQLVDFQQDYTWTFSPETLLCDVRTSAPNLGVTLLLGGLWVTSCCLVFLEVYARRLRRNISASFFREQAQRRKEYLMRKTERKKKKKKMENQVLRVHVDDDTNEK